MANASTRIEDIAQAARDDMDVSVIDRLPGGDPAVDAHVQTVHPVPLGKLPADLPYQLEQLGPFVRFEIFDAREMAARNHQHVPI